MEVVRAKTINALYFSPINGWVNVAYESIVLALLHAKLAKHTDSTWVERISLVELGINS